MEALNEIKKIRKKKSEALKKFKLDPYPLSTKRTHQIKEALEDFSSLVKKEKRIVLVGRIKTMRCHGGSTFLDIEDGTGKIQVFLKKDRLGEKAYNLFLQYFDLGDFIEIKGILFLTKKKEKTILADDFKMLSKSILPLPEKWYGLKDVEERFRKRYLDLIFNADVKDKFLMRSRIIQELRNYLIEEGFIEVETPILQTIYGGAKAKPFKTHHNALDIPLYMRIATELHLKELLIGGYEKIFEIGRIFRNEGIDRSHNPDFTSLEFYWAYADYKMMMKFTEEMISKIVKNIFGKLKIKHQGKVVDFKTPWKRVDFYQLIKKDAGIDLKDIHPEALAGKLKEKDIKVEPAQGIAEMADQLYKTYSRPKIWNPTFVIHHPYGAFPLAKSLPKDEDKLANFQLVAAGWELVNAFSELNDPVEQRNRFKEQEEMYRKGYEEAQRINEEFLEALEYGMPPAAGFGIGIDRLVALLTDSHSLREVILFPLMKPKND